MNRERAALRVVTAVAVAVFCASASCAHADVVISTAATQNMTCSGGVCAPTAAKAALNVIDLENLLASGSVTVTTTGSGGVQSKDIRAAAAISWSSANTLAFDAYHSIEVDRPVSVAGAGGLSLAINDGGTDGTLSFGPKGNATFASLSNSLTINGATVTLEDSVSALASAIKNNPGGNYALSRAYDASQDGTYGSSPVATTLNGFFEGLGNAISNLSISDSKKRDLVGLFAHIGSTATVENLTLAKVHVVGNGKSNIVGGLAGETDGTLFRDSVSGRVKGGWLANVGGLVGLMNSGNVTFSRATARVQSGKISFAGGLVGNQQPNGTISGAYATGAVVVANGVLNAKREESSIAGGLVGSAGGSISSSFATGGIAGDQVTILGGLIGYGVLGTVNDSYATGTVTGGANSDIGGFAGDAGYGNGFGGPTSDSYSTGAVSGGTGSNVGGFAGFVNFDGAAADSYWDTTTSGTDVGVGFGSSGGITGLTTEQLQSGLPDGFSRKVWAEDANINGGLPYLIANPPPK